MWRSISYSIPGFGRHEKTIDDLSDDETLSNASIDEGLECPICFESFNIVENVPYVLWCGHTLCKNCILGLRWTTFRFSAQQIKVPFFVSCPWCNLLTLRFFYKGNLKFPSKNFFLLWMVESRNGDRQQMWAPRVVMNRRCGPHRLGRPNPTNDGNDGSERLQLSLHKSLDFFIRMTAKVPLVVLLLIVVFAIPASGAVLLLYLVITVVFAMPSFLVVYFAYPALDWLGREIRT
ncbi:hypothetical protein CASFOL_024197 [Castilleja foliolosa]|uniref:RING-type domain-containing protein n=1 Tax=Castilleja foliolosa TaxID=1961234 RepID=A0ABD3CMN4_9LAMI